MQNAPAPVDRWSPPLERSERRFWIALACAFLAHAALFISVGKVQPHTIGDESGIENAIAIDLVTQADLESREIVNTQPSPPPVAAPTPPTPAAAPPPAAPPAEPPAPPKAEAAPEPPAEESVAALPAFPGLEEAPLLPEEGKKKSNQEKPSPEKASPEKPSQEKPAKKSKPAPQAKLDLTPPNIDAIPPSGRSAAFSRPPGITRSGANDDFGRDVIRALRRTMPPPDGTLGRVTVRFVLTPNGDLSELKVIERADDKRMTDSVEFAVRQSVFPFPPNGATPADRTFIVSYIYR